MAGQSYNLNESNQVVIGTTGVGQCWVAPNALERWHITRVAVKTTDLATATKVPQCDIYLDSVSDANFLAGTYSGSKDASDEDVILEKGQLLWAQWTGGNPGTTATLSVFGTREVY